MTKAHYDTINDPSGDVVIRHAAYSGCSRPDTAPDTLESAASHLATLADRYEQRGYPVTREYTDGQLVCIVIESPDDAGMVGDVEGTYAIVPHEIPAAPCWACGDLVAIGETCDCQIPDPDEDDEE